MTQTVLYYKLKNSFIISYNNYNKKFEIQQYCEICFSAQHKTQECNYQQIPKCYICGDTKHIITDCPYLKQCKFCGQQHQNGLDCNNIFKFYQNYDKICYKCGGNHFPFLCMKSDYGQFRQDSASMCPYCGRNHPDIKLYIIIEMINKEYNVHQNKINEYSQQFYFQYFFSLFLDIQYSEISDREDQYDKEYGESLDSESEYTEESGEDSYDNDIIDNDTKGDNKAREIYREQQQQVNEEIEKQLQHRIQPVEVIEELKSKNVFLQGYMSNCFKVKVKRGKQAIAVAELTKQLRKQQIDFKNGLSSNNPEIFSVMTDLNDQDYILVEAFDVLTVEQAVSMIKNYVVPFQRTKQRQVIVRGKRRGINQNHIIQLSREAEQQSIFKIKPKLLKTYYLMKIKTKGGSKQQVVRTLHPNEQIIGNELVQVLSLSPYISLVNDEFDPSGIPRRFGIEQYEQFATKQDYNEVKQFNQQQYYQGLLVQTVKFNKLKELRENQDEKEQIKELQLEGFTQKIVRLDESLTQLEENDLVRIIGKEQLIGTVIKDYNDYTYKIDVDGVIYDKIERNQLIRHFDINSHVRITDNGFTGIIVDLLMEDQETYAFIRLDIINKPYRQQVSTEKLQQTDNIFIGQKLVKIGQQSFQPEQLIQSETMDQIGLIIYICQNYAKIVTDDQQNPDQVVDLYDYHRYNSQNNRIDIANQRQIGKESKITYNNKSATVLAIAEFNGKKVCWAKFATQGERVYQCVDLADVYVTDVGNYVKRQLQRQNQNQTMIGQTVEVTIGKYSGKRGTIINNDGESYTIRTGEGNIRVKIKNCQQYNKKQEEKIEREKVVWDEGYNDDDIQEKDLNEQYEQESSQNYDDNFGS